MELISPVLRTDFREFCVSNLVLRQINDLFTMAGIRPGTVPTDRAISGQRRALVEEYYASLNWHLRTDAERFLKVLEFALVQSYVSDEQRTSLRRLCEREGIAVDGVHLRWKTGHPSTTSHAIVAAEELARFRDCLVELTKQTPQTRGFALEKFLQDVFEAHGLAPRSSFRLVGEQIDGSFQLNADVYLVEAKWQSQPTAQEDLLVFQGKVEGKSGWSRGLFLSMSGFSEEGLVAFSHGRATKIIGMSGQDLYVVLSGEVRLERAIEMKVRRAGESGEVYVPLFDLVRAG